MAAMPDFTHALNSNGRAYCGRIIGPGIEGNYVARRFFLEAQVNHCPKCFDIMTATHIISPLKTSYCGKVQNDDLFVMKVSPAYVDLAGDDLCVGCEKRYEDSKSYREDDYGEPEEE